MGKENKEKKKNTRAHTHTHTQTRQSGKWSMVCYVGSSCEGVGFNQWLPLQCKCCMNIKDVHFGKSEIFDDVHVKNGHCA